MRVRMLRLTLLLLSLAGTGCATGNNQQLGRNNQEAYHYQMGLSYLGERNFTGALVELTEAERLEPDNPEVLYNLGMAYIGKKRPDLAEQKLQRALTLKPNYSTARNDLGVAYLEMKRWDNAIQQFKLVRDDIFYDNAESAAINLGLAYLGKGEYPKALEELRGVIAANPRKIEARLSLGRVYFAMDRPDQAIVEYRKALEIYKEYGDAYYYMGLAYLKVQDIDSARKAFKEVVRIKPDSELGRSSLRYLELLK